MNKVKSNLDLPKSIVNTVIAICGDYERRERLILLEVSSEDVINTCKRINEAIDKALLKIEPGMRKLILSDIKLRKGYDSSKSGVFYAKNTYYSRKRKLIHDIAAELFLID